MRTAFIALWILASVSAIIYGVNIPVVFKAQSTDEICGCMSKGHEMPNKEACKSINMETDKYELIWVSHC